MTRTGRVPELLAHTAEPTLAMNPADAVRLGVTDGGFARIETDAGTVVLRAETTHALRRGEVFAPMHWTDEFSANGPVDRAVSARRDPLSGQPALKSTPARVVALQTVWHGLLLRSEADVALEGVHWTRVPVEAGHLFRLSGLDAMPQGAALDALAARLLAVPDDAELLEMKDARRGVARRAVLRGGKLLGLLMVAPIGTALPAPEALAAMLGQEVADAARGRLLSGRIGGEASEGKRVCACFGVTDQAIRHACVTHRLRSSKEVGELLGAGTNCGSCVPEIDRLLKDVREPAA
jgi:assimilatory nitrate reductase catalytic subunit